MQTSGTSHPNDLLGRLAAQVSNNAKELQARRSFSSAPLHVSDQQAAAAYAYSGSIGNFAVSRLDSLCAYNLLSLSEKMPVRELKTYAGKAYTAADELGAEGVPLLDFFHKNNRSFDFRI